MDSDHLLLSLELGIRHELLHSTEEYATCYSERIQILVKNFKRPVDFWFIGTGSHALKENSHPGITKGKNVSLGVASKVLEHVSKL
jgi:hypothetical protein